MSDILRATRGVPGFHAAARLLLIEASPVLRARQAERLAAYAPDWCDHADALPDAPLFFVANEFFDALPIRQFVRGTHGWSERLVTVRNGALAFALGPETAHPALAHRLDDTAAGAVVELCPALSGIAQSVGTRIAAHGGVAMIVDYGDWRSRGDTLQAMRAHDFADPLEDPGTADLTAHVDFEALAHATPSATTQMMPQGVVLDRLGITPRAQALARALTGDALESHVAAHRRLTHPDEMGNLFKMLAFYPEGAPLPPGFA
jgi:SAM-dependent MidA family methyltransferase